MPGYAKTMVTLSLNTCVQLDLITREISEHYSLKIETWIKVALGKPYG